jgi:hypothetical protein
MKVEILEVKLSSHGYYAEAADRLTVPDDVGMTWCQNGWAKDLSGQINPSDRVVTDSTINPIDLSISVLGESANG